MSCTIISEDKLQSVAKVLRILFPVMEWNYLEWNNVP